MGGRGAFYLAITPFPDGDGRVRHAARCGSDDDAVAAAVVNLDAVELICNVANPLNIPLLFAPAPLLHVVGTAVECPTYDQIYEPSHPRLPQ